jgi:hypothetical protein|tara:strand:- start:513 stop:641 length:129 start_codon:yes stop_codon:yes gene_type:complete
MGRMKEVFMAEREASRNEGRYLDNEYHYAKWKEENGDKANER